MYLVYDEKTRQLKVTSYLTVPAWPLLVYSVEQLSSNQLKKEKEYIEQLK